MYFCVVLCIVCVVFCIVCVYMCTELLPPGGYPIAVNKYIVTRKQLIWYGHVESMDPTRLPKIVIHCKPEGRKKRGRPWRTWKDGIFTAMNERDLRIDEWNNRRQCSSAVLAD
jgi:hypothetical protein